LSRPTLLDVAHAAEVDRSTASRALDPARSHLLKPETIARVTEAARRLGYHGNALASSLRRGRTNSVGIVIADFQNPFISPILRGVENGLDKLGIVPLVTETEDSSARLESAINTLLRHRPDAIIMTAVRSGDRAIIDRTAESVPVVLAVRTFRDTSFAAVAHDDREGGVLAAQHLIALGHTRIAQLCGPSDVSSFVERAAGFRRTLRAAGLPLTNLTESARAPGVASGYQLMQRLLKNLATWPTGVFAHTDLMAVGAIDAAREAGLRCPEDVSVIGYDDIPLADHVDPPLTTVRLPGYQLGRLAAELVATMIGDETASRPNLSLPPELVVRRSTAPAAFAGSDRPGNATKPATGRVATPS